MRLEIERDKWCRGGLNGESALLNAQECRCCLGFLGKACGVEETSMKQIAMPRVYYRGAIGAFSGLRDADHTKFPDWLYQKRGDLSLGPVVEQLAHINDDRDISDHERERRITEILAEHGVEAVFV